MSTRRNKTTHCYRYVDDPFVFDLSDIPPSFSNPRNTILGDLKCLVWVLRRGVRINNEAQYSFYAIFSPDRCHLIKDTKRSMKYALVRTVYSNWKTDNQMVILMRYINKEIFDRNLPTRNYYLGKLNLLRNDEKY